MLAWEDYESIGNYSRNKRNYQDLSFNKKCTLSEACAAIIDRNQAH